MKRFLVFLGEDYYPNGGWRDCQGSYDNKDEAVCNARASHDVCRWWHVVDTLLGDIVASESAV